MMEINKRIFLHLVPSPEYIIMLASMGPALYSLESSMAFRISLALEVSLLRGVQRSQPAVPRGRLVREGST